MMGPTVPTGTYAIPTTGEYGTVGNTSGRPSSASYNSTPAAAAPVVVVPTVPTGPTAAAVENQNGGSGKYNHWNTSYRMHYGGNPPGSGATAAAPGNTDLGNGHAMGMNVVPTATVGAVDAMTAGATGTPSSSRTQRPMSAGATLAQRMQHQAKVSEAAAPVTTVTVPTVAVSGPKGPVAGGAAEENDDEEDPISGLGETSGLNGMTARRLGQQSNAANAPASRTAVSTGVTGLPQSVGDEKDFVDVDEDDDDELDMIGVNHGGRARGAASNRSSTGPSKTSQPTNGVVDYSQSRTTHPEVSTIAGELGGGGTISMDFRSMDSFVDEKIPANIGLTTVPNQFCTVVEALELRKILLISNNNARGGIVPSSTAVMDMYMVGKVIGVGSYGKVRAAWHRLSGSKVAIKTYDKAKLKDPAHWKRVHSEIKITEQTSHPRIARLYEAIETPKRMHLIMECLDGGNLCTYVKQKRRLSEEESKRIFFQLLQAIDYLHTMGVAHRDIKLENVLFNDNKDIKLIDFGFSTVCVPGKKLRVFCGTPSYMAPGTTATFSLLARSSA